MNESERHDKLVNDKLDAEIAKLEIETRYYGVLVLAGFMAAMTALGRLLFT